MIALIIINAIALGIGWSWFLIGGPHFRRGKEFDPMVHGHHVYSVERYLFGGATIILGISWLFASLHFLGTRTQTLNYWELTTLISLHFLASLTLLAAGIGVFRFWQASKVLYMVSVLLLMASVLFTVLVYGPVYYQNSMLMYVSGAFILFGICLFIAWLYLLESFTRSSEEERQHQKR